MRGRSRSRLAPVADQVIRIAGDSPSEVRVGDGALGALSALLERADRAALVADERALELHGDRLRAHGLPADLPTLALPAGEACKDLAQLGRALEFCAEAGLSRRSLVLGFGGGAATDLAGLAAALFKRGVPVAHIPTTLVGQVDAALGGKTAIDLPAGKNLAGAFHMPVAVLSDPVFLGTLPEAEHRAGLGEVVKSALLAGPRALAQLEADAPALAAREQAALARAVAMAAGLKARVVEEDPLERGPRRSLNLGHTFGHAIETVAGHGRIPHGLAVAAGLILAVRASAVAACLEEPGLLGRLTALHEALGLPTGLADLGVQLEPSALWEAMGQDKKGSVGRPEFVLLARPGEARLGVALERAAVEELLIP